MASIAIVGAGQSGLHLGIGLLMAGHQVTLVSNRTGAQIAAGTVLSSQSMYGMALGLERELGIDCWQDEAPPYAGAQMRVADSDGNVMLFWQGAMDEPGQSIDQRVKMPRWIDRFVELGGDFVIEDAGIATLERLAAGHDLTVVAAGKGEVGALFERDPARSPFTAPQRVLALTYVNRFRPRPGVPAICININPGIGEFVSFPGLTLSGPCEIFTIECIPGGPMDQWADVKTPEDHLAMSEHLLRTFFPIEAERIDGHLELTDPGAVLRGRVTPTTKHPVATLPSGAIVMGLGDVVCLNDPLTGQGSNNAAKAAKIYLDAIAARGEAPFDRAWMEAVFETYWDYARYPVAYTNQTLGVPPEHMMRILKTAESDAGLAHIMANSFNDPKSIAPWYYEPAEAETFLAGRAALAA
ncbi:styrene monooxygenase/indole monooxygenase family protein [Novosphingobium sp. PASSN1]|uniref:styrene monooxygenase/indole monooxygenase family protein n=1 Tax=Novosphingobium sp. PASSN1 TaxID=2015561 RepID=UPI000BD017B5|nr:styrene monooxygenase/indole monooxygenase family protein [Novosphingobium sp. PASSN1]OYU33856.1 MAG: alanine-phosphoribitol ligase [Novosphingobium sp. PASSN1]